MTDIVERLREIARMKVGDPMPEWMGEANNWGVPLGMLCGDAANEIERLQHELNETREDLNALEAMSGW